MFMTKYSHVLFENHIRFQTIIHLFIVRKMMLGKNIVNAI